MKQYALYLAGILLVAAGCSSPKQAGSEKLAPTSNVATVFYERDVAPIVKTHCSPCHFPPDGKKTPYDSYDAVKSNLTQMIHRATLPQDDIKFMPYKLKKPALTDSLVAVLQTWKAQGFAR
jgi:hypothetical protein